MDSNLPDLLDPVTPILDAAQIDRNGLACDARPSGSLTGKIALIQRGTCSFNVKLDNAAVAGAAAAVVYNNQGTGLLSMVLSDASLPALFIAQTDGQNLKSAIAGSSAAIATLDFAALTPFPLGPRIWLPLIPPLDLPPRVTSNRICWRWEEITSCWTVAAWMCWTRRSYGYRDC